MSNIHVYPEVLSTLISLQQGNLHMNYNNKFYIYISNSTLQQTTLQTSSPNVAKQQLQEGEI